MFSYYGSKSKLLPYYPPPAFKTVIEPFAGSAKYSLLYWKNDIILNEINETVFLVWKWLQQASPSDIQSLPTIQPGEIVPEDLDKPARDFVAFNMHRGRAIPTYRAGSYSDGWQMVKNRAVYFLDKIRHWDIRLGSYDGLENMEATWFIDPPYQYGGQYYPSGNDFNYKELGEWCMSRRGQVIVCENTKADWLPFRPLKKLQGSAQTNTTEAVWDNGYYNDKLYW